MDLLLKSALIVDPQSPLNGKKRDLHIVDGKIASIKPTITGNDKTRVIRQASLCVSPGWFDMCANFCDPGTEFKEDMNSGLNAAARGGFTGVLVSPATEPPIDSKSGVEYLLKKGKGHITETFAQGTISQGMHGLQLSEMMDMSTNGAKAFGDYKNSIESSELMNRALEYSKNCGTPIITFPLDPGMSPEGVMHEGAVSVSLGLKGMSCSSEEIRVQRDVDILRYTGGHLHILAISTGKSAEIVRQAKKEGLKLTCGIAAHQLAFTDRDLDTFDTRLKVNPPFRTSKEKLDLIRALKVGTIDVIISDHSPHDVENKKREFEHAAFGISSLETSFSALVISLGDKLPLSDLISKLAIGPRKILGLRIPTIAEGESANLTLFNASEARPFSKEDMISKSKNNPFGSIDLRGNVVGVIRGRKSVMIN